MKYKIISSTVKDEVEQEVNVKLKEGYKLKGDIIVANVHDRAYCRYTQVMVIKSTNKQ